MEAPATGENQHWVPKFLIRKFADTDGRVFQFDIRTDEVRKPPPKYAASAVNFNEFIIQGEEISFETRLEKIETKAAPALGQIVEAKSLAGLTIESKTHISEFIAAQSFRTEAFYKGFESKPSREEFGAMFAELWRAAFLVADEVRSRLWALMEIPNDPVFYLGDHPVVLQFTEEPGSGKQLGFDIRGVEAYMPISPKHALYMPCNSVGNQIVEGVVSARAFMQRVGDSATNGSISKAELDLFDINQRVLNSSTPLYEAFINGTPLPASSENVENLNYLQCAWAHAAIYSNRPDFSFAKHVLARTPEYRQPLKTSITTFPDGENSRG